MQPPLSIVDVIIPVYRGAAETRACIESVLAAKNTQLVHIVVVDDASPEPEIGVYLTTLTRDARITLVNNDRNLGFVASCNLAMRLHPDRDLVLLNSDTLVADGWLDRMVACAVAVPNAASVTPFSNNATICSYPRVAVANALPTGLTTAELDRLFASVNAGRCVDIPTAVGFCMLMKRTAIDTIGLFDEEAFGRGYGEENDWCLRGTALGYSHQLCGGVFVYHQGEVSFRDDSLPGKSAAQLVIDTRYPHYRELISRHLADDPARLLRRQMDVARLSASTRPRVLFITHNWGGGTEKHVNDLTIILANSLEMLVLKPHGERGLSLRWARDGEEFEAYFEDRKHPQELLTLLRAVGISRVHLHHVQGLPAYVLDLHTELGVPLDITLHDYFPLTQRYHVGPDDAVAAEAVSPVNDWGLSDIEWRQRMGVLLTSAARIIAPSRDLAQRMQKAFQNLDIQIHAHPDSDSGPVPLTFKVLVLGALTVQKGLKVLEACATDARERQLPLFFKLLGHAGEAVATFPAIPLAIGGTYRQEDLDQLIALERADAFLFPSQIPETYSYTLTSALRANLPIVASALGAFTERLDGNLRARLLPWNAAPAMWNETLLEAIATCQAGKAGNPSRVDPKGVRQAYANWYLGAFLDIVPPRSAAHDLSPGIFYEPKRLAPQTQFSLQQLFDIGVERGHAPSVDELRRRAVSADLQIVELLNRNAAADGHLAAAERRLDEQGYQIAAAERQMADARRRKTALDAELDHLRRQFREMQARIEGERDEARTAYMAVITSTSWKVMAPLRGAVQWARKGRARFTELRINIRHLPRMLGVARQILVAEGVGALLQRVREKLTRRMPPPGAASKPYIGERNIVPLDIESSPAPKFSLIMPVYGQHLLTFNCLKSIAETCNNIAIEILVIDDYSPQPAAEALQSVSGITVIRNPSNLGFLSSCNIGASMAKGEFVVILNNDLILTGNWLTKMEAVYHQFPDTGLVGAKLIYPDGRLQEAGGIVWRDGSAWNVGRDDDADKPEYNYVREVDYCSGACLLIRRDFWNSLGGFDTAYAPAYYEDTDLAFRVRAAGKRVFYQPHAVVVHFEGQSSGTDVTQGIKRHQVINQKTFATRWDQVLQSHGVNGTTPHRERNRYTRTRILVIDACMLTPDQDAGSLRMFEMLGLMRSMGNQVTFIASNLEYRLPYVADIQALGVEVLHHPHVPSLVRHMEEQGGDYDIVILSRETVASQYLHLVKRYAPRAKVIFDTVDLHFLRAERQAALSGEESLRAIARSTRERELALINAADLTLVVSPMEQELLKRLAPRADVKIVATIHVPMPGPTPFAERDGILFIGGFRHPPNLDAVTWYVEKVLPFLRVKHPGLVTMVIGSNAPPSLQRFAGPDFVIAGFVPDVTALYNSARLSISPLRYGAGVKGKVNLAMQYGVPVVATTISVEGMYLINEETVLVADEPEAFADAVIRLHTDEVLWDRLRLGGLDNIDKCFSRNSARRALESVLAVDEALMA